MHSRPSHLLTVAALGSVIALGACKKSDSANPDTTMAMMTKTDSAMDKSADTTRNLSDDQILGDLDAINSGEIDAGKMAQTKSTNADVKAFAKQMVTAHTKMKSDGAALAAKIAVTPKSPADSAIVAANDSTAAHLTSASKGMPFDTAYVNAQVAGHQMALDFLRRASSQAQNADLKKAVTDAIPVVQSHLDMAQSLQAKIK